MKKIYVLVNSSRSPDIYIAFFDSHFLPVEWPSFATWWANCNWQAPVYRIESTLVILNVLYR